MKLDSIVAMIAVGILCTGIYSAVETKIDPNSSELLSWSYNVVRKTWNSDKNTFELCQEHSVEGRASYLDETYPNDVRNACALILNGAAN